MVDGSGTRPVDAWLLQQLACPRHQTSLVERNGALNCDAGCVFPVVDGVPVLLMEEVTQTMHLARTSLRLAGQPPPDDPLFLESLGLAEHEKQGARAMAAHSGHRIDPVVSFLVGATNGIAYKSQIGRLGDYPIPDLRMPSANGEVFLDLGCSWGRWCVAAARKGYTVIGIDPSLGAVLAARRVARQLGVTARFVVGDARYLPFRAGKADVVFSYSVLQHFSRADVRHAVAAASRVLKDGGVARVQMPNKFGIRCLYHQARRGFREATQFEVRYWTLPALRSEFSSAVGEVALEVDCFFGIGLQASDLPYMTRFLRLVVLASEALRRISGLFRPLVRVADSVWVTATKPAHGAG